MKEPQTLNSRPAVTMVTHGPTDKPFDAVHHPDQSEDSQDEDDVQDLPAGVPPGCIRTTETEDTV